MYLIGSTDKNCNKKQIHVPVIEFSNLLWRVCDESVGHHAEKWNAHGKVVPVSFNEVMACDGGGINVVLPEWTDQSLKMRAKIYF